jgi:molybdopterin-containing oxidoreductase family membrane subunit
MTIQPMWHSTIFGPYFVVGAIFSGVAAVILAMAGVRWHYGLQTYLKRIHFNHMGLLLLVLSLLWLYFTFAEHLTVWYGNEPSHMAVFREKFVGKYASYFWIMVALNFVIPFSLLVNRRTRGFVGTWIASASVTVGMFLERFTIVVPTLMHPRLPFPRGEYTVSWVEWSLMAGCAALLILLFMGFTKLFPIISVWEVQEGRERGPADVAARIATYLPAPRRGAPAVHS